MPGISLTLPCAVRQLSAAALTVALIASAEISDATCSSTATPSSLAVGDGDLPPSIAIDMPAASRASASAIGPSAARYPANGSAGCAGRDPRFEHGPFDADRGRTHFPVEQGQPCDPDLEGSDPPADRAGDANRDAGEHHAGTREEVERSRLVGHFTARRLRELAFDGAFHAIGIHQQRGNADDAPDDRQQGCGGHRQPAQPAGSAGPASSLETLGQC